MLRRLALTAAATAAVLSAVLSAAPGAWAVAAPIPLPMLEDVLEGTFQKKDRLTVTTTKTGNPAANGTYELECEPTGGTHPEAKAACARLDELAGQGTDPFAAVPSNRACTQQYGGDATARITGTWNGRPVDAVFNRGNGCEISRWRTMEPVLPSVRA
ncbi:SSI family serine proteinase inhibitor [Streptomyces hypolithicus]